MEAIESAEDAADTEDADAAMTEPGESISWEDVKAESWTLTRGLHDPATPTRP